MSMHLLIRTSLLVVALAGSACASTSSIRWNRSPDATGSLAPSVFVMEPLINGSAAPGNAGRDFPVVKRQVRERLLTIVSQRSTVVNAVVTPYRRVPAPAGYPDAIGGARVTEEERDAAKAALASGATHLLIPTILEWTEMRTDDPLGALILPHTHVAIELRLMRLQQRPALAGDVVFKNRARLTLNQSPMKLLDDSFRAVVLQLVSGRK